MPMICDRPPFESTSETIITKGYVVKYWYVYRSGKHHRYAIYKHRWVWEINFGEIPDGYVVHHIDGNKQNNDIDNLRCMPLIEHSYLHHPAQGKLNCIICGRQKKICAKGRCAACYVYLLKHKKERPMTLSIRQIDLCKSPGCDRIATRKGLCHSCYQIQWQRNKRKHSKLKAA